ncbi:MAG: hypothetical protein JW810_14500 [Sedimentisphaerales bacterium]|nr:hypothetical protein [Sedimentisphaerales bacterium]
MRYTGRLLTCAFLSALVSVALSAADDDALFPPDQLTLIDQVHCGGPGDGHRFTQAPAGATRIETILQRPCRVLTNEKEASYFAYRLGESKGLKPAAAYLLVVEYPEDQPRSLFVSNRGAETILGFHTGSTVGDILHGRYTSSNPESLRLPLSGRWQRWQTYFHLHERYPDLDQPRGEGPRPLTAADGFWVVISQPGRANQPLSAGAAVGRIALYEVKDPETQYQTPRFPPADLPRRHLFYREEMSDGVIAGQKPAERGVARDQDWYEYKARLMAFLGMNTFCKDLLEFGHNQGWDATPGGGDDWYWSSKSPQRWRQILEIANRYHLAVLPYYEYCGGVGAQGLGKQKRCLTLSGSDTYTHVSWCEFANLDLTDPDSLADATKLLDVTILAHKDRANVVGAWFRPRPSQMPISFSDQCLQRFAVEANARRAVTRQDLQADADLLQAYYRWWFGRRRAFLTALRDHLRTGGCPGAVVLFTADAAEAGRSLTENGVVTDDPGAWSRIRQLDGQDKLRVIDYRSVVDGNLHLKALLSDRPTWSHWEWQHSCPRADPEHYTDVEGVLLTYSFNRAYTVASPDSFAPFRTPSGLAAIRHYFLNESEMHEDLGYFVADVERAGPYCLLAEARAVAYGDPRYLGYLASNCFNRGFPQYVRPFYAAFLALPAVPGVILPGACGDADIVVRRYETAGHGTYLAVVNVGYVSKPKLTISLSALDTDSRAAGGAAIGVVTDAATGRELTVTGRAIALSLPPCQLRAIHIAP